jgi:hypothetical protein
MTKRKVSKIVASTTARDDPAFRAISSHRRAARIFNEVVVEYGNCSMARHLEATAAPRDAMFAAGDALVKTKPTTMAGAVAMLRYLATVFDEPSIPMESNIMPETVDEEAWQCAVFRTLAAALVQVQPATAE